MQYREMGKTGDKVSILGFGCMRLQHGGGRFDESQAERLVRSAIDRGVNYLDTAYLYLGNEALVGRILSGGYRDKVFLAQSCRPCRLHPEGIWTSCWIRNWSGLKQTASTTTCA